MIFDKITDVVHNKEITYKNATIAPEQLIIPEEAVKKEQINSIN